MADCSYSRCIQQKRYIRRELQRWTKNMVYIVGLERIAEELMGRRKWKLYQESRNYLQPINNNVEKIRTHEDNIKYQRYFKKQEELVDIEDDLKKEYRIKQEDADEQPQDWSPQSKCYFCIDGKLDSENNTSQGALSPRQTDSDSTDSHSDSEIPPTLTPPTRLLNNNHNMTAMAALASAVAALSGNPPATPTPPLSFYNPNLIPPNWYLANMTRNYQPERVAEIEKTTGEQPLDLSSKGMSSAGSPVEIKPAPNMRLPTLDTKQIFKAKPRVSTIAGRRTYTEDELQAALRDIQSGKLGTRRAAVIYGIPRSTLRNKVYKLAMERERELHINTTVPLKLEEEEVIDEEKELSGAEEEKEVEKALQAPLLSMADILRFSNLDNQEALKTLLQRGKEGSDSWTGLDHSAMGPYIQNLLLTSGVNFQSQKPTEKDALLSECIKRLSSDDRYKNNGEARTSPSSVVTKVEKCRSESSDMETDESPSNVILKIPSFKPTTSKNGNDFYRSDSVPIVSPPVTSESGSPPILPGKGMTLKDVKDVIAKSISQKFQQTPEPIRMPPIMEMDYKRTGFTPPMVGMPQMKNQHDLPRPYPHLHQKPPQNPSTSGTTGGKGTRPKRGKYRNYDRDSLVEAVRAVQRGEMSVHRAGSYYGVPHSTLEYKVKERHLMRPRKRDPKPNPVDEKLASLKQNDLRMAAAAGGVDKMKPVMKPPQPKFPPTSPNGMKLPMFDPSMAPLGYNPPPFPFWPHPGFSHIPLEYGRSPSTSSFPPNPEFFTTQMIQKIQDDVRTHPNVPPSPAGCPPPLPKNARHIAESLLDGTGSNGSFLDGIIRSSLESGVPGSDDKAIKDDKSLTPENMSNKALLDQLCRNSRLTPLPKPNVSESNSSGDENYRRTISPANFSVKEETGESSPKRYDADLHTIELSNDSMDSVERNCNEEDSIPPARIYLKQDLVNPDNLKPEMLVRFRDVLDVERNGDSTIGSASESDVAQD
ncbi:hypothetical protein PPYR_11523 [Photinus pyralis]|uniref:HTH psq-type domain-containing protein n=1 Tax=Photinus pyralis TaxID=7054 RepID=A0A1Y1MQE4_PHOPY|nr:mushroom body large-type Kenyon cell-specific protein 1 isoform X2 [Photinus pyralis]KAB0794684.1 hypothetical protein PPYR_11523 [Photinus pyralis]